MRASPAHLARARRLLVSEGAGGGGADQIAAAAGRVYDKLHDGLAPLLGVAGVAALLARSARLVRGELVDAEIPESAARLREHLVGLDPAAARATATALFGNFFALMTTFIGDRLTIQLLRSGWPAVDETGPGESET